MVSYMWLQRQGRQFVVNVSSVIVLPALITNYVLLFLTGSKTI